jgi:hypothetical protein
LVLAVFQCSDCELVLTQVTLEVLGFQL